jgi:Domain of unknown function (DUF4294)
VFLTSNPVANVTKKMGPGKNFCGKAASKIRLHLFMRLSFVKYLVGFIFLAVLGAFPRNGRAQDTLRSGGWARLETDGRDSVFVMSLRPFRVTAKRLFKDFQEQRQYYLYMRAARKVYPYALQAVDLYEELQAETKDMSKGQRRRHIRRENKELKEDFKDKLKNLSRTEGKVLIKMIEREVGQPFYTVIADTRGSVTAAYWHNLSKMWGYDLKDGYRQGADPLLDEILWEYDFGRE